MAPRCAGEELDLERFLGVLAADRSDFVEF